MSKGVLLALCLVATAFRAIAQEEFADASEIMDSVELQEVVIQGVPIERYAAGSHIQTVEVTENTSHGTLAELLGKHTSLYLQEYGSGMLANISLRGMTAQHTAILWNGININSLTLGQTDLALAPAAAIDRAAIHYGSAGSLYGSDAIGGAIHLSTAPKWNKGFAASLRQDAGSFETFFSELDLQYGKGPVAAQTNVYRKYSGNNFPFLNPRGRSAAEERQENAAFAYHGVVQEFNYKIDGNQIVSLAGWYNFNDREIQPNMFENGFPENYETIEDRNLRLAADYAHDTPFGYFNFMAGYVRDHQLYNQTSKVATGRYLSSFLYEKDLGRELTVKAGADWKHIRSDVDSYDGDVVENQNDLFASVNYRVNPWWKTTVNFRKTLITGFGSPFTPSWGNEFLIVRKQGLELAGKAVFSTGYRVPTLNDRFWPELGNPDLLPERSSSGETGFVLSVSGAGHSYKLEATGFVMDVTDMIIWTPLGSDWRPVNQQRVLARGLEMQSAYAYGFSSGLKAEVALNYTYTRSEIKASDHENELGNQMPYTPYHAANLSVKATGKKWRAELVNYYIGERYTTAGNSQKLPGYLISDISVGYRAPLFGQTVDLMAGINNLFDVSYQNYASYAMPGRSYRGGVKFSFNKP